MYRFYGFTIRQGHLTLRAVMSQYDALLMFLFEDVYSSGPCRRVVTSFGAVLVDSSSLQALRFYKQQQLNRRDCNGA